MLFVWQRRSLRIHLTWNAAPCCLGRWASVVFVSENGIPGICWQVQNDLSLYSCSFQKWLPLPNHYYREICIKVLFRGPVAKSKYFSYESKSTWKAPNLDPWRWRWRGRRHADNSPIWPARPLSHSPAGWNILSGNSSLRYASWGDKRLQLACQTNGQSQN